jgi:hypothetical protein
MKAYRTCRRLLQGRSRFHHPRCFNHFLPSVLSLLVMIPTPRLLRLQPQLPLMRHPHSNSLLLLVRPLAPPKLNLRHPRRLQTSPTSLVHLLYPTMRRGASTLRPQIVKVMVCSASTLQRHPVLPVRGLQHLRLHVRRLPSPLHPRSRSHRPSCRAHDQIRYRRLPSQRDNRLL